MAYFKFASSYEECVSSIVEDTDFTFFCKWYLPLFWIIPVQYKHLKKCNPDSGFFDYFFVIERNEYLEGIKNNSIVLKKEIIERFTEKDCKKITAELDLWIKCIESRNYSYCSIDLSEIVGLEDIPDDMCELIELIQNAGDFPLKNYILEQLEGFMDPSIEDWSEDVSPYLVGVSPAQETQLKA